jgi:hypothetical protein
VGDDPKAPRVPPPGRWLRSLLILALLVGALLRVARYLAPLSLWGDEAALALNVIERPLGGLFAPLDMEQVPPIGFLLLLKAASSILGPGERALRLISLIGSLAALVLFVAVARLFLRERGVLIATLLMALSEPMIVYSAQVKHYGLDVLATLVVIGTGVLALRRCDRVSYVRFAAAGLLGVMFSLAVVFPFAFMGGLLVALRLRQRDWPGVGSSLASVVPAGGLFLAAYFAIYRAVAVSPYMSRFWTEAYPPRGDIAACVPWFLSRPVTFFCDPGGFPWSIPAFLVFLLGVVVLFRTRDRTLLLACLGPLGLVLAAAILRLHPFPTAQSDLMVSRSYPFLGRLLLFALPATFLVMAAGIEWVLSRRFRFRVPIAAILLLSFLTLPVRIVAENLVDPPRIQELRGVAERMTPWLMRGDPVFTEGTGYVVVRYYAHRFNWWNPIYPVSLESLEQAVAFGDDLKRIPSGRSFLIITLEHPLWPDGRERMGFMMARAGEFADVVRQEEGFNALAVLYRVR